MRVAPEFFGKRKRRGAGDEFYYNKIRASKVSVDDVGGGVLDAPQWIYQTQCIPHSVGAGVIGRP